MAERAFTRLEKKLSTSLPAEAKTPMPVMTTLRKVCSWMDSTWRRDVSRSGARSLPCKGSGDRRSRTPPLQAHAEQPASLCLAAGGARPPFGHSHQVGDVLALEHPGEAVDRLPDVLHVLRHGVRDVDLELRFEGKEDVDGIERVDSQLGKRRIQFDDAGLKVLFTCDDVDHFFGYVVFHGLLSPLSRFDFRGAHPPPLGHFSQRARPIGLFCANSPTTCSNSER